MCSKIQSEIIICLEAGNINYLFYLLLIFSQTYLFKKLRNPTSPEICRMPNTHLQDMILIIGKESHDPHNSLSPKAVKTVRKQPSIEISLKRVWSCQWEKSVYTSHYFYCFLTRRMTFWHLHEFANHALIIDIRSMFGCQHYYACRFVFWFAIDGNACKFHVCGGAMTPMHSTKLVGQYFPCDRVSRLCGKY